MEGIGKFLYPHMVAKVLSINTKQVSRLVNDGELRAVRIGKRGYRVSAESLNAYIERNTIKPGYLDKS